MNKINFENLPSTNTPLNADNLNLLQTNVEDVFNGRNTAGNMVVDSIKTKNLFSGFLYGAYNSSTGVFSPTTSGISLRKTKVESGATYYLSGMQSGIAIRVLYWNNDTFVSSEVLTPDNNGVAITMAGNQFAFQTATTNAYSNVMLEKGEEKTDYKPYENLKGEEFYSGIETKIGTWIDGKPLYKKVINFTTASSSVTSWTTCATITNMNRPINIFGFLEYGASTSSIIPIFESSTQRLQFSFSGGNIQYQQQGYNSKNCYAVVIYTKTTD